MKRVIISLLMIFLLAGCSPKTDDSDASPTIVCTGFAQYEWVMNILGDESGNWNVIRLNEKGADMHSYQPSARDMVNIVSADLIVYTGGSSEDWIIDVIEENEDFGGTAYCLLEHGHALDEASHGHEDEHEHEHDEEHCLLDEHIWLSPKNAMIFIEELAHILSGIDPSKADLYESNAASYISSLEDLDCQYAQTLSNTKYHTLIFADRFPFLYLAEDYGLEYYAAFPGCSAETEASFDTIIFLSDKLKESGLSALLITESSQESMANTIIKTSGLESTKIYRLNSLQSVTDTQTTYLGVMEQNLQVLMEVLN